ncbi:hypothetical protein MESS4_640104 [Mesorhizobium sp. STM 4661]|nr:hypothetical protein MESS4_640104 [Mesorhizobium sp. STM 4661]
MPFTLREQRETLKRVAFERIHATRFKVLFLCMSLSQNRCALLRDMHKPPNASFLGWICRRGLFQALRM